MTNKEVFQPSDTLMSIDIDAELYKKFHTYKRNLLEVFTSHFKSDHPFFKTKLNAKG